MRQTNGQTQQLLVSVAVQACDKNIRISRKDMYDVHKSPFNIAYSKWTRMPEWVSFYIGLCAG